MYRYSSSRILYPISQMLCKPSFEKQTNLIKDNKQIYYKDTLLFSLNCQLVIWISRNNAWKIQRFSVLTGWRLFFVDERMSCFFFAVFKYAIKSETVVRLRRELCFAFRGTKVRRVSPARAITHSATWLTQDPSFVRRPPRKRKMRGSNVFVVREHRKGRQLCRRDSREHATGIRY